MSQLTLEAKLERQDQKTPWGFRMQGGKDFSSPLAIARVLPGSLAAKCGIQQGDVIVRIGSKSSEIMTHQNAQDTIISYGNKLDLLLQRIREKVENGYGGGAPTYDKFSTPSIGSYQSPGSTPASAPGSQSYNTTPKPFGTAPAPSRPPASYSTNVEVNLSQQTRNRNLMGGAPTYDKFSTPSIGSYQIPGSTPASAPGSQSYNTAPKPFGASPVPSRPPGPASYSTNVEVNLSQQTQNRNLNQQPSPQPSYSKYANSDVKPGPASHQSRSFKYLSDVLDSGQEPSPALLPTVDLRRSPSPRAPSHGNVGGVKKQFNSPIGLYSNTNIQLQQTAARPMADEGCTGAPDPRVGAPYPRTGTPYPLIRESSMEEKQLTQLISKCGGEIFPEFQKNTTHVIMYADKPRCCERSLKYLQGISHHCWILDHRHVEKCLQAGYYLPEGEFEIVGDTVHPNGDGASLSRLTRKKIFSGLKTRFTGDSNSFCKDNAEDILQSLGGEVDISSSCVISMDDEGEPHTVSRDWLFDCLSNFTALKMDLYYSSVDEQMDCVDDSDGEDDDDNEDYEDDEDYIPSDDYPSEESDSESIVCSLQDTTEDSLAGGSKEQDEIATPSLPEVHVQQKQKTIHIATAKKTADGKRIWDKKHNCIYCMKQFPKLARHLEQVHTKEFEVQKALAYEKKSFERKQVWREIMNKGDFVHNAKVLENETGEIIPVKRPSKEADGMKYIQCESCLGTFLATDLWRHVKKCHPDKGGQTMPRRHHQISSASLLPVSLEAADDFHELILNRMANDTVSLIARIVLLFTLQRNLSHFLLFLNSSAW